MIRISLNDGSIKEFPKESSPLDIAKNISEGFARNVISKNYYLNQQLQKNFYFSIILSPCLSFDNIMSEI